MYKATYRGFYSIYNEQQWLVCLFTALTTYLYRGNNPFTIAEKSVATSPDQTHNPSTFTLWVVASRMMCTGRMVIVDQHVDKY